MKLTSDLRFDSFGMMSLLVGLEDEFGIELEEADMNPFDLTAVTDVVTLVLKYCGGLDEEDT